MNEELKACLLADVEWLHLGSTNEYKDVKKFIADICYDVARAACIDEICINDICVGFRQRGYEVIEKCDLDALRAAASSAQAEVERLRDIIRKVEWVNPTAPFSTYCLLCAMPKENGHHENCTFYQWEGNNK